MRPKVSPIPPDENPKPKAGDSMLTILKKIFLSSLALVLVLLTLPLFFP